jgi:hypothetical protein
MTNEKTLRLIEPQIEPGSNRTKKWFGRSGTQEIPMLYRKTVLVRFATSEEGLNPSYVVGSNRVPL